MMQLTLILALCAVLLGGCGRGGEPTSGGPPRGDVATSPAGVDEDAPAALPHRVIQRAREFRGNPIPLGILTGTVLLVAFVLGVYTLYLVYRRPRDEDGP